MFIGLFWNAPSCIQPRREPWSATPVESGTRYDGLYTVFAPGGKVRLEVHGSIVEHATGPADVFVYDPPAAIREHQHGPCFQLWAPHSRWFKVHFDKPPRTFEVGRACIERILAECIGGE